MSRRGTRLCRAKPALGGGCLFDLKAGQSSCRRKRPQAGLVGQTVHRLQRGGRAGGAVVVNEQHCWLATTPSAQDERDPFRIARQFFAVSNHAKLLGFLPFFPQLGRNPP